MNPVLHVGIDIGSTTIKAAVLSPCKELLWGTYVRHMSEIKKAVLSTLDEIQKRFPGHRITAAISGSGGMGLASRFQIPFYQEILAETKAVRTFIPDADVIIELGGEDEKITYLRNGVDQRMNGACAGGTGAFIDRMASLLSTDAAGLEKLAQQSEHIYPIASRCGVFAKTDVQALLNDGATSYDIAASVFQAVVNQTISGLTCGRPIKGKVVFLGGPLTFQPFLRTCFTNTLNLSPENAVLPEHSELYVAIGSALAGMHNKPFALDPWLESIHKANLSENSKVKTLPPLFRSEEDYEAFRKRHAAHHVPCDSLADARGAAWLGIDAGSTTIKAALINEKGHLLYQWYSSNHGTPLEGAKKILSQLYELMPSGLHIAGTGVTGYGEDLIKSALTLDMGEVETIAHYRAAVHFCPDVTTILDIGGQDMKCSRIKNHSIDSIMLNEACSSGCGSFLDTFAHSLGMDIQEFSKIALFAEHPVDLGSRCTVFMNSRVREAQKNAVSVADISAGLSYSVIKNALYKVIRLHDASELGNKVVVQGGTFYNDAVLRALENLLGCQVIRPDISGLMGAYGMALLAQDRFAADHHSSLAGPEIIRTLTMDNHIQRCPGCGNHCMLTVTRFSDGRSFVTGNRCERGASLALTGKSVPHSSLPNMYRWKMRRLFSYRPLAHPSRGTVGIPRVLNMYEDYPFWHTFFTRLGLRVILSPYDMRDMPMEAMETIPSYSECYPAKLVHGHIYRLLERHPDFIWYPCVDKGPDEGSENTFMCPMVTSYPETIAANMDGILSEKNIPFLHPFLPMQNEKVLARRLYEALRFLSVSHSEIRNAIQAARKEQESYRQDLKEKTLSILHEIQEKNLTGIVLAGRPYHLDPTVHHGIPDLINQLGMAVLSEDGISMLNKGMPNLRVLNQWSYHNRLYKAADFVTRHKNLELVELNSFGCGLDAIVTDQVQEIMSQRNRLYTALKIDQGLNLGAVRIRLRSLKAAISNRTYGDGKVAPIMYSHPIYTPEMNAEYTILVPEMSPVHFPLLEAAGRASGYNLKVIPPVRKDIDVGLASVNNDACYPAIITIGSLLRSLQSGEYDLSRTAVMLSQTGGACRASNYIGMLKRALARSGFSQIPVISLNTQGLDRQPGFELTPAFMRRIIRALIFGDALMQCLLRVRPYEALPGAADRLVKAWQKKFIDCSSHGKFTYRTYSQLLKQMISEFDHLPLTAEQSVKPKVGVVGEIYVKFSPIASNDIFHAIEQNGGEVEAGGLIDFLLYGLLDSRFQHKYMGGSALKDLKDTFLRELIEWYRRPYEKAIKQSRRFHALTPIGTMYKKASHYLSLGHRAGEGWFLTAEMIDLLAHGARGIVCLQPFACLPNHITGEGMIHKLHQSYPEAVFLSLDCDSSASQVNQLNRLKLMLNSFTEETPESDESPILHEVIATTKGSAL